jgi:hypothetical protein
MYRHDLFVAARVVNNIEKELMQSAWEQWVVDEHRKCRIVEGLVLDDLKENSTQTSTEVKNWYEDYCTSCGNEYQRVVKNRAMS